jgi:hypothetical protein
MNIKKKMKGAMMSDKEKYTIIEAIKDIIAVLIIATLLILALIIL